MEQELGMQLPKEVRVVTVEETQDTIYLVLPSSTPIAGAEGAELSDRELESVAGGWEDSSFYTCGACSQGGCL